MYRAVWRILVAAAFICGGIYAWNHLREAPPAPVVEEKKQPEQQIPDSKQAQPLFTVRGPLADYVLNDESPQEEATQPSLRKPSPKDRIIEDSPVGTSSRILHRTFAITRIVHIPFQIPPHALTPRFHGKFQSLVQGVSSHDEIANVDLLLMNEKQYGDFAAGRDPDVLFLADTCHYRDISVDLSPSGDQPVRYHLVFRSPPGGAAKKVVQADFSVDF